MAQARGEKSPPAPLAMLTSFPAHPGRALHVEVFTQVSNAPTLLADLQARKVRPMDIDTMKEIRTYTCIAVSDDDSTLYCGTYLVV